jgi:hypothetical protein
MSRYESLDKVLVPWKGEYPVVLVDFRQDKIAMETIIILNECLNIFDYWTKHLHDQILFPEMRNRFEKYRGFLPIEKKTFNQILLDMFN